MGLDQQGVCSILRGMCISVYGLPVILCTTYSVSKAYSDALVDDTVMKSSNFDELKMKIDRILGVGSGWGSLGSSLVKSKKERRPQEQMGSFLYE